MEMTKKVGNVDGFKRFYNDFVKQRMDCYRIEGKRRRWLDMAFLLMRGPHMEGSGPGVTVELRRMKGDAGNFIVKCADDELWPLFTDLWQAYDREWGEDLRPTSTERQGATRPSSYRDKDTLSTLVYYLKEHHGKTLKSWCDQVGDISVRTCTNHKKKKLLLSPDDYKARVGESIEDSAQRVIQDQ
jgi:hypothetical protein